MMEPMSSNKALFAFAEWAEVSRKSAPEDGDFLRVSRMTCALGFLARALLQGKDADARLYAISIGGYALRFMEEAWSTPRPTAPILAGTLHAVAVEVERARAKFPSNRHMFAALAEEVGELADVLNQAEDKPGDRKRLTADLTKEAMQVACVAARLIDEGDVEFDHEPEQAQQLQETE